MLGRVLVDKSFKNNPTPFRSPLWPWVAPKLCTSALSCLDETQLLHTVDYLEFMVLTTLSKTTLWQLSGNMFNKTCCWGSKQELHIMDELSDRAARRFALPPNQSAKMSTCSFYVSMLFFCQSVQQDSHFEWSILILANGLGTISNFGIRILFKTLKGLSRNALRSLYPESCHYSSWWDVVDAKRRAKPGIHSTLKILFF